MGSKNANNAQHAMNGANAQPGGQLPAADGSPVLPCAEKHWIAVRVEFEDGTLVESGIQKTLALNNGDTRNVSLDAGVQSTGSYTVGKIMDDTTDCKISFPNLYDAEVQLK